MKNLIIGDGEIGQSLYQVIKNNTEEIQAGVEITSETNFNHIKESLEFMHIAFGYDDNFEREVKKYQKLFKPKYTVIHSTVPVGTSKKLKSTHSPVVGKHPELTQSLYAFTKFVGGKDVDEVADYFRRLGMKVQKCQKSETTEFAKLQSTLFYGVCIEFTKEMEKLCDKYNIPFAEAYTLWTQNYNEGYKKLDNPEYTRPILQPLQKKIGGHCIESNLKLSDSKFAKFINDKN